VDVSGRRSRRHHDEPDPLDFFGAGECTPGDAEWQRRLALFEADPSPWEWWWLSFVDNDRPEGDRFLGVAVVPAPNVVMASQVAWALGCNPGGEVAAYPAVPDGWHPKLAHVGRLFAGDEARAFAALDLHEWAEPDPPGDADE
jgi:hypothetical protein